MKPEMLSAITQPVLIIHVSLFISRLPCADLCTYCRATGATYPQSNMPRDFTLSCQTQREERGYIL